MNAIEQLVSEALEINHSGDKEGALEKYNDAFNLLIDGAAAYAKSKESDTTDIEELRSLTSVLFSHSKEYLKKDLYASEILNAMGVLFGELGDYENAKQKFEEAIIYIPDGVNFDDPEENIMSLPRLTIDQDDEE